MQEGNRAGTEERAEEVKTEKGEEGEEREVANGRFRKQQEQ